MGYTEHLYIYTSRSMSNLYFLLLLLLSFFFPQITLPQSTVIFDASQSRDDEGPENLSFHWQLVAGPIGTTGESNEALLTLNNPQPGQYTYKWVFKISRGGVGKKMTHKWYNIR